MKDKILKDMTNDQIIMIAVSAYRKDPKFTLEQWFAAQEWRRENKHKLMKVKM